MRELQQTFGCLSTGVDKDVKSSRLASFEWSSGKQVRAVAVRSLSSTVDCQPLAVRRSSPLSIRVHPLLLASTCGPPAHFSSTGVVVTTTPSHRAVASEVRFAFYPPCRVLLCPLVCMFSVCDVYVG